jgi:hypothetical protein
MMQTHFKNDYPLSPEDSARIDCDVPGCDRRATTGQSSGCAPFYYHCDFHAELGRRTGRFYTSE